MRENLCGPEQFSAAGKESPMSMTVVRHVDPRSPAHRAGVRAGDTLLEDLPGCQGRMRRVCAACGREESGPVCPCGGT